MTTLLDCHRDTISTVSSFMDRANNILFDLESECYTDEQKQIKLSEFNKLMHDSLFFLSRNSLFESLEDLTIDLGK